MWKKAILGGLGAALVLIQLVPVRRDHPTLENELVAPSRVEAILRRACYDCHSHRTHWPWYAYVAPASWLIAKDVRKGRDHLNFSLWNGYGNRKRTRLLEEIVEEVESGEMPLWFYTPLHPTARLTDADLATLREWATTVAPNGLPPPRDPVP